MPEGSELAFRPVKVEEFLGKHAGCRFPLYADPVVFRSDDVQMSSFEMRDEEHAQKAAHVVLRMRFVHSRLRNEQFGGVLAIPSYSNHACSPPTRSAAIPNTH